jgi:hypothetical protein
MKRKIILSLAGITGAAAFAISQSTPSDPSPSATPAAQATESAQTPAASESSQNCCGWSASDKSEGRHWRHHCGPRSELRKLDRMLNLSEEQTKKIDDIVDASKPKIKAIREEERMKIRAVFDDVRNQIRPVLSSDQQKVFDDAQELRERARKLRQDAWKLREERKQSQ